MGVFNQTIRLTAVEGGRSLDIDAMVDTGASYTIVPAGMLNELGVSPIDKAKTRPGRMGAAWSTT